MTDDARAPPCLRHEIQIRSLEGDLRALTLPDGSTVLELSGAEAALSSVLDGQTPLADLEATATVLGLPGRPAVEALLSRLAAAGCLTEDPRPSTALALRPDDNATVDELMRRATILAARGIDGPARELLLQIEQLSPGRPEVAEMLATLHEDHERAALEERAAVDEIVQQESSAETVPAASVGFTYHPRQKPAMLGLETRRRLRRWGIAAAAVGAMALIPIRRTVYAPATLRPWHLQVVRSPVEATVQAIAVRDGARVRPGQVLVELDPGPALARIALAEAELHARQVELAALEGGPSEAAVGEARAVAQARAADAARVAARCEDIERAVRDGVRPRSDLDACRREQAAVRSVTTSARSRVVVASLGAQPEVLASARGRVAAATEALAVVRADLERRHVRSPVAGTAVVAGLERRRGGAVREGEELLSVAAGHSALALIPVSLGDAGLLELGARVSIRARALGASQVSGVVTAVADRVARQPDGTAALVAEARVDAGRPLAVAELTATAEIEARRTSLLGGVLRRLVSWLRFAVLPALEG